MKFVLSSVDHSCVFYMFKYKMSSKTSSKEFDLATVTRILADRNDINQSNISKLKCVNKEMRNLRLKKF